MATCPHGLDEGTCLICSTLAGGAAVGERPATRTKVPPGKVEVIDSKPRGRSISLLGILVAIVAVALAGWFVIGLLRGILHVVELIVVGIACGYLGYRVGKVVGRRSAR